MAKKVQVRLDFIVDNKSGWIRGTCLSVESNGNKVYTDPIMLEVPLEFVKPQNHGVTIN